MSELEEQIKKVEKCPECGLPGETQPPAEKEGKKLIITFKCPNGHIFQKYVDLK